MLSNTVSTSAPQFRRAFSFFVTAAVVTFGLFIQPAFAQEEKTKQLWQMPNENPLDEMLAPQSTRPDIFWMRGGHFGLISQVTYSPNGQLVASLNKDSGISIKLHRASDGMLIHSIRVAATDANSFVFTNDGQFILIGTTTPTQNEIKQYRVSDGGLVRSIPTNFNVYTITISPNNQYIGGSTIGFSSQTNAIWNFSDGSLVRSHYGNGGFILFTPDNHIITDEFISGGGGNSAPALFEIIRTRNDPPWIVQYGLGSYTALSPNGQYLTAGGHVVRTATCVRWVVSNPDCTNLLGANAGGITTVSFSSDGQYLAGGFTNGNESGFKLFRTSDWALIRTTIVQSAGDVSAPRLTFSPNSQHVISGIKQMKVWSVADGSLIRELGTLNEGEVGTIAFSTDGQILASGLYFGALSQSNNKINLFNVANGNRLNIDFSLSNNLAIRTIGFADNNQKLITLNGANNQDYLKVWNAATGALISETTFSHNNSTLTIAPNGQSYAIGSSSINVYNASDNSLLRTLSSGEFDFPLAISPNGEVIVSLSKEGYYEPRIFKFWRISDGAVLKRINANNDPNSVMRSPLFSPDGQHIAFIIYTYHGNNVWTSKVELLRISDGVLIRSFTGANAPGVSVAFSPDGQYIFATGQDATVRIWRVSDGILLQSYTEETGGSAVIATENLKQIAVSPDGSRFAYGRKDATVVMAHNPYATNSFLMPTAAGQNVSVSTANGITLDFNTVSDSGNTVATAIPQNQLQPPPSGYFFPNNAPAYDITTSALYSGNITVTFNVPNVGDALVCSGLRSIHFEAGAWTTDTNAAPIYNAETQICTVSQTVTSLSPFAVAQVAGPTAATVSVGGRVTAADGSGIRNALVTLTDSNGNARTVLTGKFGAYRFRDVAAGETYVVSVSAKRYRFSQPSQVRIVSEALTDVDFVADGN